MSKNYAKHASYDWAFKRIADATQKKFFLEATTVAESIISDRLLSFLKREGRNPKLSKRSDLGKLLAAMRAESETELDLIDMVDEWRASRNEVLHSVAKSDPGTPTQDPVDFLCLAKSTASRGHDLARAVDAWHKKKKRQSDKS